MPKRTDIKSIIHLSLSPAGRGRGPRSGRVRGRFSKLAIYLNSH